MTEEAITPGFSGDSASPTREAAPEATSGKERPAAPPVEAGPTPGATPSPPVGTSPAAAVGAVGGRSLYDHVLRVQAGVDKLLDRFDEKLLHDEARTNEIKRLNAELARHQPDAQWNTARPFVDRMVRHLDEIQRFVQRYEGRSDATPKDFVEAL